MTSKGTSLTELLAIQLQRPVDARARRRAARLVLDWVGCVLGALHSALARQLVGVVRAREPGHATAVGIGGRSVDATLLLNAALGNVLEMDDVHRAAILHPGPVVIPVALAACEQVGATPTAFLDAVVRGYEATIRVGQSLGTGHYQYWHPTSTSGAFGAAAAAASAFALGADATADALGTAGSRTGGLWQMRHERVPTKSIHNAEAAHSGWLAACLARAGVRGPRHILEGEQGVYAAMAPGAIPEAVNARAADWLIHATSLKPWPACRHVHPAIGAMLDALGDRIPVSAEAIASIEVVTYASAQRFCDRVHPYTELEAKFSLQHAMAAVACLGRPQLWHYGREAIERADIAALRHRVSVQVDAAYTARFPAHYGATVRILMRDGQQFDASRADAWGDPECALDDAAIHGKAAALAAWGGVPDAFAADLFTLVDGLPAAVDLAPWSQKLSEVPVCA